MFQGRRRIFYAILLAGLLAVIWVSYRSFSSGSTPTKRPLSDLLSALESKQVASATFTVDGTRVDWKDQSGQTYRTFYPNGFQLVDHFQADHIRFTTQAPASSNTFLAIILPNLILFLLIGGFMWYILRTVQRGGGGRLRFGGARPPPPPPGAS